MIRLKPLHTYIALGAVGLRADMAPELLFGPILGPNNTLPALRPS